MADNPFHTALPIWQQVAEQASLLADSLQAGNHVLTCAESCTGGLVAAALTSIPGSSAWFDRGFVTYDNQAKVDMLGVDPQMLEQAGAVSEIVARQMALGALQAAPDADMAVSTTGVAGPGGGTPDKPVGMVCFGVAWRDQGQIHAHALTQQLAGDRAEVRAASVETALRQLRDVLKSLA